MYINKPLIHGSKFKTIMNSHQSSSSQKKDKKQKDNDDPDALLKQLLGLIQILQNNYMVEENMFKRVGYPMQFDEAYEQCIKLLNQQEEAQISSHARVIKKIRMQDIAIQNYTKQYFNLRKKLDSQIENLSHQISDLDDNINLHTKKNKKRMEIMQKIQQEQLEIDIAKDKLHQLKQKSYQQKNQYIQTQASQFRLEQLIQQHQSQFKRLVQNEELVLYYKKLEIIKKKLLFQKQKEAFPMEQHLQNVIDKISRKRVQLDGYQRDVQLLQDKIQQQNFIIQALKQKCKFMQKNQESQEAWLKYKQKYNEIYFGNQNQGWNQYKKYLDQLLKKDGDHFQDGDYENESRYMRYQDDRQNNNYQRSIITEPPLYQRHNNSFEQKPRNYYKKSQSTPLQMNLNKKKKSPLYLPKLIKMEGKREDQGKIKQQLTKFTNNQQNQDYQLVSVKSGQQESSGEIIQVQFHTKKQNVNKKTVP